MNERKRIGDWTITPEVPSISINSKVAVVMGGKGNIGMAVCQKLTELGYEVEIPKDFESIPKKINTAIYLRGINHISELKNLAEDDWHSVINMNLTGAYKFAKASFVGLTGSKNASFITVSSILSQHPYPERLAYAAAKGGLESLTRGLAIEWGKYNISTHCIRLGHLSSYVSLWPKNERVLEAVKDKTPSKYLVTKEDVASYIGWLIQGNCKAVNGSVIDFDSAYCINRWPL